MSTELFVGVDGGGTHARAVVIDGGGRELARRTGPSGLVDPRDPAGAARVVADLARAALSETGARTATALCCGLAGAGRQQERAAIRIALTLEHIAEDVSVIGDAEAAMSDAFPAGAGVLLVGGTGSIAWGRRDGDPIRVGGWGQLLGDEGGGYAIGLGALRAVTRAADRGQHTSLTDAVLTQTGVRSLNDLVAWSAGAAKSAIAALAPVVLRCAGAGDAAAVVVRARAIEDLADLAVTAAQQCGLPAPTVALTGGLIAPGGPLRDAVIDEIADRLSGATFVQRPVDAALGAARLARGTRHA